MVLASKLIPIAWYHQHQMPADVRMVLSLRTPHLSSQKFSVGRGGLLGRGDIRKVIVLVVSWYSFTEQSAPVSLGGHTAGGSNPAGLLTWGKNQLGGSSCSHGHHPRHTCLPQRWSRFYWEGRSKKTFKHHGAFSCSCSTYLYQGTFVSALTTVFQLRTETAATKQP